LRYLRCPYAFYMLDRGLIGFHDTVNEQQARLIDEGVAFQESVESTAVPRRIEATELPRVFAEESVRLFQVPVFENWTLQIYGQPDGVDTAQGALFPVEIKSHKEVQRSDELELAFYWMLLEPYRTKKAAPRGFLLLRREGVSVQVELEIPSRRFGELHALLEEIRAARQNGVQPRNCGCPVCSGIMGDQVRQATLANKDLTLIWGVGRAYARCLEKIGIRTYEDLPAVDSSRVVEALRSQHCCVSVAQVETWKHHAASYSASRPVVFGDPLTLDRPFVALDLEYESLIWLIGGCLVTPTSREHFALWADTPAQEKTNLNRLAEIVADKRLSPLVTWNGNGADIPQLRNAMQRLGLGEALGIIEARHFDLYEYARKAVRFPIPELALQQVARYFSIPKVSSIRDGLEARMRYQEYRGSQDHNRRIAIKTGLLEYNHDDVDAVVGVAERLATLVPPETS
jgi:predicted RecB family nuclease